MWEAALILMLALNSVSGGRVEHVLLDLHRESRATLTSLRASGPGPRVNTSSGLVQGVTLSESHAFYNIPYGEITSRYMSSIPSSYQGEIDASAPDYIACYQPAMWCPGCRLTEDCLILNINVPSQVKLDEPDKLLPVMVYIHGGSFLGGSANNPELEGRWFANSTNTILVTINYRLGPLGFLVFEESGQKFEGNQGFKDQQLAMNWVYDNIIGFGGDNNQVTLFGESAGAQSVVQHLVSANSAPLFKRAIILSTPAAIRLQTRKEAMSAAQQLLDLLNCTAHKTKLDCLLNENASNIVDPIPVITADAFLNGDMLTYAEPFRPVLDGVEFQQNYLDMFQSGEWQNDKEVMIGNMLKEMGHITVTYQGYLNESSFKAVNNFVLGENFGPPSAAEYIEYSKEPTGAQVNYTEVLEDEMADVLFYCPSRALARFISETSKVQSPVYFYMNAHAPSGETCSAIQSPEFCEIPIHASELPFVFRTAASMGYDLTSDDVMVMNMFSLWWSSFAYNGIPSDGDEWPPYVAHQQTSAEPWTNIRIQSPNPVLESSYRSGLCDYWDSSGIYVNMMSQTTTTMPSTTSQAHQLVASSKEIFTIALLCWWQI